MSGHRHGIDQEISRTGASPTTASREEIHARDLQQRLQQIADGVTYREISDRTGVHSETVRRYVQGGRCSSFFLAQFCKTFGINGDWLLTGRGERGYQEPLRLEELSLSDLIEALAIRQRIAEKSGPPKTHPAGIEPKPLSGGTHVH